MNRNRESYFFIDIQSKGIYPSYIDRLFKEKNIQLSMYDNYLEIMKDHTVDFIALNSSNNVFAYLI